MTPGYVYILTNPSFREDWLKIGKSSRPVDVRTKELDNTAVPLPFEIYATLRTVKYHELEQAVHKTIDRLTDLRIRQNREFFNVPPAVALDILRDLPKVADDAVVTLYEGNKPVATAGVAEALPSPKVKKPRRENFRFSMVDIPIGAMLTFEPTGQQVRVPTDNKVEYEGRLYSPTAFAGTFMPEARRNRSGAYHGQIYLTFEGETLSDRRARFEAEASDKSASDHE